MTISKAAKATRRRALGRRLVLKASSLTVDLEALKNSPDLQHLTPKEGERIAKLLKALETVKAEFNKMAQHLEKSE